MKKLILEKHPSNGMFYLNDSDEFFDTENIYTEVVSLTDYNFIRKEYDRLFDEFRKIREH